MKAVLKIIGSLRLAVLLLVLLMVAMGSATVYESQQGTEQALRSFYHAHWFKLLLALFGVNLLASLLGRWPFGSRQIGFVLTHVGLLMILLGAWISNRWAINGQLALNEGKSANSIRTDQEIINWQRRSDQTNFTVELSPETIGGFEAVDRPLKQTLRLNQTELQVLQYLPDLRWREVVSNDAAQSNPAVQVELTINGETQQRLIYAQPPPDRAGELLAYRVATDPAEYQQLLAGGGGGGSVGEVIIKCQDEEFRFTVEQLQSKPAELGSSGYQVRLLRYLPHATVGAGNQLQNIDDQPTNPAVEVEVFNDDAKETRIAFARFPDFESMHEQKQFPGVQVQFEYKGQTNGAATLEIIQGPAGTWAIRQQTAGLPTKVAEAQLNQPVPVMEGVTLTIQQAFTKARSEWQAEAVLPVRQIRNPALLVELTEGSAHQRVWLEKYHPTAVQLNNGVHDLTYADQNLPLGFSIKLNAFRLGTYPGSRRPRTFESRVTIEDGVTSGSQERLISMNHPTSYGGFTFFQSSYQMGMGPTVSVLSVSRDPGQWVVFAGYAVTLLGMLWVLAQRLVRPHAPAEEVRPG
ncbi:MAG: Cytochrome c biogenesis protein Ccs1 [Phycisphaerae bacterium]|nr:Cytochrome c biogenesis protein Ccs1 [Phycisphaerae bacterium]